MGSNNPIGSTAMTDLFFNAGNLDKALNSTGESWIDRFGVARPTYKNLENKVITLDTKYGGPGGLGNIGDSFKPATWSGFAGGADKTGVNDSTTALSKLYEGANTFGQAIIIPKGLYKVGNEVRDVGSDTIWLSRDFNSGVSATDTARKTPLLITVGNPDEPVLNSLYTRVGINITAIGRGAQHIDCIRGSLINQSTDGQGNTAFYGSAISLPGSLWSAALHGETKHEGGTSIAISSENASYTTGGTFYGMVINNTTGTAAETNPSSGTPVVAHPTATALYITGGTTRGEMGQWVRGIRFAPLSMRSNGTLIRDESDCAQGFWSLSTSKKSVADIFLEGTAPQAIIIQGTYSSENAIRIRAGLAVAFEQTGAIKTKYSTENAQWGLWNGATQKVGFDTVGNGMFINGKKVIGTRVSGLSALIGNKNGSAKNTTTITVGELAEYVNFIADVLLKHGLAETTA